MLEAERSAGLAEEPAAVILAAEVAVATHLISVTSSSADVIIGERLAPALAAAAKQR